MLPDLAKRLNTLNTALHTGRKLSLSFVDPAHTTMLAAFIVRNQQTEDFILPDSKVESYLDTIDFYSLLWGKPRGNTQRSAGMTYCPLIELSSPVQTDTAATTIAGILLRHCGEYIYPLVEVIGELLDNVWAHGKAVGYAAAQVVGQEICFAVSDLGKGFLQVLKEARISGIESDLDAINWGLQEGHTSKGIEDDWAQALPFDSRDNPFSPGVPTRDEDNHHEGLGLYKLVELVRHTQGSMAILSGYGLKTLQGAEAQDREIEDFWQGAVISCSFNLRMLRQYAQEQRSADLDTIINAITR